jgi:hypothetical protein
MRGFKVVLIGLLSLLIFGELAQVSAAQVKADPRMRRVSGAISWIDVKLGLLELKSDAGQETRGITEYKINLQETRVTDPTDTKFLVIKDLRPGQHVTIELIYSPRGSPEETMIRKIIAEPIPEPVLQEAAGELEAIDVQTGTIIISQKPLSGEEGKRNFFYFVFNPKEIVILRAPGMEPVQLDLKPGDIVKVGFVVREGQRHARSITLLQTAPETTSTTTTTTTTTSTRKIIVEPTPTPASQEATGELEAIDAQAGTLMIEQKPLPGEAGENNLFFFVFDPKEIVVMKNPSAQPVQLEFRPGDIVKVEFVVKDGKRHARSVTLMSEAPETASTTTVTTVSTTVTK